MLDHLLNENAFDSLVGAAYFGLAETMEQERGDGEQYRRGR